MRAAVLMGLLAIVMVVAGATAFSIAPEGANAITALIVPSACALVLGICALLSALLPKNRRAGMIGIHAGLVFTLLFAAAIGHRAYAAWGGVAAFEANEAAYAEIEQNGEVPAFESWVETEAAPHPGADHDKTYLAVTLTMLAAANLITFGLLIASRPKPAQRGGGDEPSDGPSDG